MAISIKGILAGLVSGFVLSLLGGMAMGFVLAVVYGPERVEDLVGIGSGTMTMPVFFMDAIVSVAAGYIAAWVAGRGELVNAALCNLIAAILYLLMITAGAPGDSTSGVITLVSEPLFGLLGGYIRLRQRAEYA